MNGNPQLWQCHKNQQSESKKGRRTLPKLNHAKALEKAAAKAGKEEALLFLKAAITEKSTIGFLVAAAQHPKAKDFVEQIKLADVLSNEEPTTTTTKKITTRRKRGPGLTDDEISKAHDAVLGYLKANAPSQEESKKRRDITSGCKSELVDKAFSLVINLLQNNGNVGSIGERAGKSYWAK